MRQEVEAGKEVPQVWVAVAVKEGVKVATERGIGLGLVM
jgi:hypothetical protein